MLNKWNELIISCNQRRKSLPNYSMLARTNNLLSSVITTTDLSLIFYIYFFIISSYLPYSILAFNWFYNLAFPFLLFLYRFINYIIIFFYFSLPYTLLLPIHVFSLVTTNFFSVSIAIKFSVGEYILRINITIKLNINNLV